MGLTFTKKQTDRMIEVLDQDHETVDDAAKAVLNLALELFAERAKFTVVGQLTYTELTELAPDDPRAVKTAIGYFTTERQAFEEALKLALSTSTNERSKAWVVPIHHGTAAGWYTARKNAMKEINEPERRPHMVELAQRQAWVDTHPGQPTPPEWATTGLLGLTPAEEAESQ